MRIEILPFQRKSDLRLLRLAREVRPAVMPGGSGEYQALILSAPTGAGKTVMAIDFIEGVIKSDKAARFLWLSDQPELNEQTRKKFLRFSSLSNLEQRLVVVEHETFDQQVLEAGHVYFVNTQKLVGNLGEEGERQLTSFWDTVNNTVRECPESLWLVIDEVHRGSQKQSANKEKSALAQAETIMQQFIFTDGRAPVPLILGISATPKHFQDLAQRSGRVSHVVEVPISNPTALKEGDRGVKESGLIKQSLSADLGSHAQKAQANLKTLEDGAGALLRYEDAWRAHHADAPDDHEVRPILLVQVEDKISNEDMGQAITKIKEVLEGAKDAAFAHAFGERQDKHLSQPKMTLPYVPPSAIEENRELRVVFFKTSLNTGWDCPRAEVLVSWRTAKDQTYITQLIGRMVRAPLAQLIEDPDEARSQLLNSVTVYVPYFKKEEVERLRQALKDELHIGPPLRPPRPLVRSTEEPAKSVFTSSEARGGWTMKKKSRHKRIPGIRRLLEFGDLLDDPVYKLREGARSEFENKLIEALAKRCKELRDDPESEFAQTLDGVGKIELYTYDIDVDGVTPIPNGTPREVSLHKEDTDKYYEEIVAGLDAQGLEDGLRQAYIEHRKGDGVSESAARTELVALATHQRGVEIGGIHKEAESIFDDALNKYQPDIYGLEKGGEDEQELWKEYEKLIEAGDEQTSDREWFLPEDGAIQLPDPEPNAPGYEKHLYVREHGDRRFACTPNEGETLTIEEELPKAEVLGWLRNEPGKLWSFSVPYLDPIGDQMNMYPDFLIFRKEEGKVRMDILEPHGMTLADTPDKIKALCLFAKTDKRLGRIEFILVIEEKGKQIVIERLNLKEKKTRERWEGVERSQIRQLLDAQRLDNSR